MAVYSSHAFCCYVTGKSWIENIYIQICVFISNNSATDLWCGKYLWWETLCTGVLQRLGFGHGSGVTGWTHLTQVDFVPVRIQCPKDSEDTDSLDTHTTHWLLTKVLHPTWYKIGHFGDALPSQSLDLYWENKINTWRTTTEIYNVNNWHW